MASKTPLYGMAIFDFGDKLDSPLNIQKEIDRFMLIDKQLFGLYNVFGNGVIEGWTVADAGFTSEGGIAITISPGTGIINFLASETNFPTSITGLQPNSSLNIYAQIQGSTAQNRSINFITSTEVLSSKTAIRIAQIVTGNQSVSTIDNTIRDLIGFKEIVKEEIDKHKHRGTPSKIDLQEETKNQLPGARIKDFDASKVKSGVFGIDRIPVIDHNDLKNNGLLTHPQLDSFVKTLSETNKQLLGEVASVNLLKQIITLKYLFPNEVIDEDFINELALIPGISPDGFIDFDSSTAHINLSNRCISGKPPKTGEFFTITWDDDISFGNAFKRTNTVIANDRVSLIRDESTDIIIENFENVSATNKDIPGFTKEMSVIKDSLFVKSENSDELHIEGFYSGRFSTDRDFRAIFRKKFSTAQNWSDFDRLVMSVKTLSASHGSVFALFINGTGTDAVESTQFLLLQDDEVTSNTDPNKNSFEERKFDIVSEKRDSISEFIIFTDDTQNNFVFYVDDIHVENTGLFVDQGTIRFRYSSLSSVTYQSIFYETDTPKNTEIKVRAKIASSTPLLTRSSFTQFLNSGEVFALPGTDIEIEVTLLTNDKNISPALESLELRGLSDADHHGFNINTTVEFLKGKTKRNVSVVTTDKVQSLADIQISSPINVNGIYYGNAGAVSEINNNNVGVFGFAGSKTPIAPNQAINWANRSEKRFDKISSVIRKFDKHYMIADLANDRVMEVDSSGNLVKGFGSVSTNEDDFYPMCSVYNPKNGIFTIILSQPMEPEGIDVTKISLLIGPTDLPLNINDKIIETKKTRNIVEIQLTNDKISLLSSISSDLFARFRKSSFPQEINVTNKNAVELSGFRGIEVFIGDFTYMDGIKHPVFVDILSDGDWIIANSSIFEKEESTTTTTTTSSATPTGQVETSTLVAATQSTTESSDNDSNVSSVLQFNPKTLNVSFSSSNIKFSDFSIGSVFELLDTRFLMAGVVESDTTITVEDLSETLTESQKFRQKAAKALAKHRGALVAIDRDSGNVVFKYTSPDGLYVSDVDINSNGNYIVAESAFVDPTGRVVILDNFGNILSAIGVGSFHIINDAKSLSNNHVMISV